jgi:hypothetical protein
VHSSRNAIPNRTLLPSKENLNSPTIFHAVLDRNVTALSSGGGITEKPIKPTRSIAISSSNPTSFGSINSAAPKLSSYESRKAKLSTDELLKLFDSH